MRGGVMSRFQIGQQFMTAGKSPRLCTVTDILKTYNNKGELVRTRYEATHYFGGQQVTDHDVCETSIARRAVVSDAEKREELRNEIANQGDC